MQSRGYRQEPRRGPLPSGGDVVRTNFYQITGYPRQDYTLYDISFDPDIPAAQLKKRTELVYHLQVNVTPTTFQPRVLYDGRSIAFAHPRTRQMLGSEQAFRVRLRDDSLLPVDAKNATTISFKATRAESVTGAEVRRAFVDGQDSERKSSLLNFMQLIVSDTKHPSNKKAYFPTQGRQVPPFLEVRRGIFQSVRPVPQSLAIMVDTTVSMFYQSGRVKDALHGFFRQLGARDARDLRERLKDPVQFGKAEKFLKGVMIRETKGEPKRRGGRRKIKGLHPEGIGYVFHGADGEPVTIEEHYKRINNTHLTEPGLPGIILRKDPLEIVPMELCEIEPGQFFKKALPTSAAQDMIRMSTMKPADKSRYITDVVRSYDKSETLQAAGVTVSAEAMRVSARLLPPPQLLFKRGKQTTLAKVDGGKWNVLHKELLHRPEACQWAVLSLAPALKYSVLEQGLKMFQNCAQDLGLPLKDPLHIQTFIPEVDNLGGNLNQFMGAVSQHPRAGCFFILCVLEQEASEQKAALKFWGDVLTGFVTQCVRMDQVIKNSGSSQYWNNVLLKVNARISGVNYYPESSIMKGISDSRSLTMIVGLDIGHASPGIREPSVVGLVYNIDPRAAKYSALMALQEPRQESIVDLRAMFKTALKGYYKSVKSLPQNIVVFRDGVSEGEYERVRKVEIAAIRDAIIDFGKEETLPDGARLPKLTFVVVGKRHHAIIFPETHALDDGRGNCKAGTVVSEGITHPDIENFYLISHAAIIGTSRSSHYIVLLDEVFGNTRLIEELSYALCHVYAKATRSVSIPAPVYYADLVCRRKSFYFQPGVEEKLRFNDNASVASGSSYAPLDLKAWQKEFKKPKLTTMNFL